MRVDFFGPDTEFFDTAFLNIPPAGHDILIETSTKLKIKHPINGSITTITGTGFTFDANGDPTGGTVTGINFKQGGNLVAQFKSFSWSLIDFADAIDAERAGDPAPLNALFDLQPITLDATTATVGFDVESGGGTEFTNRLKLKGSDFGETLEGGTDKDIIEGNGGDDALSGFDGNDKIYGGAGNDTLNGGAGNDKLYGGDGDDVMDGGDGKDSIYAGESDGYDVIFGSAGNDKIIYTDSLIGYQELNYSNISTKITVNIDGALNTATVSKAGNGTDTITDISNPLDSGWTTGGLGIIGTAGKDTFNVNGGAETWMQIVGGMGIDTYNITLSGWVRLDFNWDGQTGATQGLNINVGTGTIKNDGFGFKDFLNITAGVGQLQIRGTDHNDKITGSNEHEHFISEQGDDIINGKGGKDTIRYDRSGVGDMTVDLGAGTASGTWDGNAFTDTLIKIENIRGSKTGNDDLTGSDVDNTIQGKGGNDTIDGGAGGDDLYGDAGNDTIDGGDGGDDLYGGSGDDTLTGGGTGEEDIFIFTTDNEGTDTITDFEDGIDSIEIYGFNFGDLTITVTGGNTEVTWGTANMIILEGITSGIDAGDFYFL
ncbi:MAG: hypothetical protein GY949_12545 [Gammaproteobacteria bacterium]|nr:hypothetical protein [Gammaproteobacteria bacterium]